MQIKIFSIPLCGDEGMTDEMNHFLRANKIIDIKKEQFCANDMAMQHLVYAKTHCQALGWDRDALAGFSVQIRNE